MEVSLDSLHMPCIGICVTSVGNMTLLHAAACVGNLETVKIPVLLRMPNADVDATDCDN